MLEEEDFNLNNIFRMYPICGFAASRTQGGKRKCKIKINFGAVLQDIGDS